MSDLSLEPCISNVISKRITASLSSSLLLVGALLIGDAIHGVIVTNAYSATSLITLLRVVAGIVLLWAGYRLRISIADYRETVTDDRRTDSETVHDEEMFDPKLSPLDEEKMQQLENRNDTDDKREYEPEHDNE